MQEKIRRMIRKRLNAQCPGLITKDEKAVMHWTSFHRGVTLKYGVLIEDWPLDIVPFGDLSKTTSSLVLLEMLWLRWKIGKTYFREATLEEMAALWASGAFAKPVRPRRSDYCVVRGQHRDPETRSKRVKPKTIKCPPTVPEGADDD
ncbi:hypothetical protein K466DRAFT_648836 [Polyporus arcularius HHB13444]|uniref:Uncharacterized protein n=1 Tax=Polyporus arcularius HHB13444 TaxID=1314778 RepID=A0A5C3NUL9_9APHY|nr:hypothetical protein K466DRAFT_648836 [Polyporus arcularius HHB13444]